MAGLQSHSPKLHRGAGANPGTDTDLKGCVVVGRGEGLEDPVGAAGTVFTGLRVGPRSLTEPAAGSVGVIHAWGESKGTTALPSTTRPLIARAMPRMFRGLGCALGPAAGSLRTFPVLPYA